MAWSYCTGKHGISRVRAYQLKEGGAIRLDWTEGGKRIRRSLKSVIGEKVTDRERAAQIADRFAKRLENGRSREATGEQIQAATTATTINLDLLNELSKRELFANKLPSKALCGVYMLIWGSTVQYVGQSRDIMARLATHRNDPPAPFAKVAWLPCPPDDLDRVEQTLIRRFNPKGNTTYAMERDP